MELLQTIWNALTNENEVLMNIVSVPMTFIEISLTFFIIYNCSKYIIYKETSNFIYCIIFFNRFDSTIYHT